MKPHSQKFLQQRKFYMVLPLLVLPFLTVIFWALGGGRAASRPLPQATSGLNVLLPGAHFDKTDEHWNKLVLYEQAKRDSVRYEQARRNDPYYAIPTLGRHAADTVLPGASKLNASLGSASHEHTLRRQEAHITERLAELTSRLAATEDIHEDIHHDRDAVPPAAIAGAESTAMPEDIARLEKMMTIMASTETNDPELKQIDGMLDKILAIQHPDRLAAKTQSDRPARQVQAVEAAGSPDNITLIGEPVLDPVSARDSVFALPGIHAGNSRSSAFYGLEDSDISSVAAESQTFPAIIHDTQRVVSGATIKMRLLSEVYIGGQRIPKDHFIYGLCTINGERLSVNITAIRLETTLLPVSLEVYDLDGQPGIYIPDAITREVAKQASTQSIQDLQLHSLDNSLEGQAATAGIEAAKGLLTKKGKLVEVTVKAGYQLLLRDASSLP
jgi:conjugative transposon TraM protein